MASADSYSSVERRFVKPVRSLLLRVYAPLVRALHKLGVSANAVSLMGPLLGAVFVYVVPGNPRLAFFICFFSVMVDGIDGALARHSGHDSHFGALMDQFCDHTREMLIVVGLARVGAVSPVWGSLYPFVYTALNVTLFLGNYYGAPSPVAIKSWIVLYPAITLYLLSGRNWLDVATPLSIALMACAIVYGLLLLSRVMDQGASDETATAEP